MDEFIGPIAQQSEADDSGGERFLEPIHKEWVATLDAIRDCVFVLDADYRLLRINHAFAKLSGQKYNNFMGQAIGDVLPWLTIRDIHLNDSKVVSPEGRIFRLRNFKKNSRMNGCVYILEEVTIESALQLANEKYSTDIASSLIETVNSLAKALDTRDPYTAQHSIRVANLSRAIAYRLDYSDTEAQGIYYGAQIHDIGKLTIPTGILSRPGKLYEAELNLIKMHCETGYAVVKGLQFPWPVHEIILQHHERLDGSGYPHGLKGKEIHEAALIVAVADVFEAMSAHRPYRAALGREAALEEIQVGAGIKYDRNIVDACQDLTNDMLALYPDDLDKSVRT
jgi:putative nucleotidyltransferase with HDIG domain